jgi:lipopolysaccharide export system protein LptC
MRDRIASLIAILLLAGVTAVSYWYSRSLQIEHAAEATRPAVDADGDGITLMQFDATGRAKYKLFADRMTHYVQTDDVDMISPRLVSLRPDQPRVEAVSQLAHVENAGERIRMSGDVLLTRASPPGQAPLQVSTQVLIAVPDQDRYFTDQPVLVDRGADSVRARGMDLNNVTQRVEFLADVVDTIAPRKKK